MIALGDSHIDIYKPFATTLCLVGGASAYGLHNKESITKALTIFTNFLTPQSPDYVISMLGEVDCNSIAWTLSQGDKSWEGIIDTSITRYINFIKQFRFKFIISSAPLSPVERFDKLPFLTPTSPRRSVKWDRSKRAQVVNYFNSKMKKLCIMNNIYFLDFTKETTNDSGLLNMNYAISHKDVHLDRLKMKPILTTKLKEAKVFYERS